MPLRYLGEHMIYEEVSFRSSSDNSGDSLVKLSCPNLCIENPVEYLWRMHVWLITCIVLLHNRFFSDLFKEKVLLLYGNKRFVWDLFKTRAEYGKKRGKKVKKKKLKKRIRCVMYQESHRKEFHQLSKYIFSFFR